MKDSVSYKVSKSIYIIQWEIDIFGSNIEYNPKFLGKIKKALSFQCLIYIINYLFLISSF